MTDARRTGIAEETMADDKGKKKALELAVSQIEKQFGKGYLIRLGDKAIQQVPVIPTGSISLDYALGTGGIPKGRITEIYGPEASGKTTLALHIIAEAQKQGGTAAFIDAEHALDETLPFMIDLSGFGRIFGPNHPLPRLAPGK